MFTYIHLPLAYLYVFVYTITMITYDEHKRLTNLAKHGLDFADLGYEFFATAIVVSSRDDRFLAIGEFQGQIVITVVFKPLGSEALSVISMRPASQKERDLYDPEI